ncbi:sensor histidine kinase [Paenibacillus sp. MZ04-78.2]|uniref:cache domain-containing sensor histidine kinase n=1 Tax=Paenibacillus sp. MZ04-78.2 TaxID=2962034 RepID=UPI0020B6EC10|nr:sensor histidine kinase [Paenibacillus sp. MZ04-78.2]MCP3775129.1 sensor histidine kinase [Paenibacillus sp. MZ04-78.2]
MKRWLSKSLKHKLSLLLLIAIVLPLLATGAVSYNIATSATEEKAKQSGMNTLRQIADKLEFVIQDVENMSLFIIGQREVQAYLDNDREDVARYTLNVGFLTNLAFSKKYISNITINSANGYPPLSSTTVLYSGLPDVLRKNEEVYRNSTKWWTPLYANQTTEGLKKVVSLVRPIRNVNNFKPLGELSISLDEAEIARYLKESGWEAKGFVLLLDANNRILSGGESEWLNRPISEPFPDIGPMAEASGVLNYGQGDEQKTILYHTLPSLKWKLVGFIPTQIYTAQNIYVLTVTAVAVGISLLLAAGLVLYFIQWVTRPLTRMTQTMKDINPDEPIPTYEVKSSDEVGLLLHSYNKLSDRIQRLKEQVQLNEAKKKEADILALQAQINPHFLYNTLSSIHWMALMNQDRQIAEMIGALSDFLRFSLNKGEEFCPVQQEIAHAQNYAYVQSIRFPGQFEMEVYIDPAMLQTPMLKLLLQPLIENSLIHGIQKKQQPGFVYVHGELSGAQMKFVVEDTGVGIEADKLREIRRQLAWTGNGAPAVKTSYGLRNVHQRLLLHYGSEAGLTIDSEPGKGTRVSFSIPVLEEPA